MNSVIEIRQLAKTYRVGEVSIPALRGVDLLVDKGEFIAIMGASGSGKSTLMNLLGCLDEASSGDYFLDGIDVRSLKGNQFADIRNQKIGFVFQGFNLLPRTSALENVELPILYDRRNHSRNPQRLAAEALERVGLGDRAHHKPNQLSGGQQQRVAIARALVNRPALILADEPTGNLDTRTSLEVLSLFQEPNDQGVTVLLITHEHDIAAYARRNIEMRDGFITRDAPVAGRRNARDDLASRAAEAQ